MNACIVYTINCRIQFGLINQYSIAFINIERWLLKISFQIYTKDIARYAWRVPVILLLAGLNEWMARDWDSLLDLCVCRSGVRTKTGINMGRLEESDRSRLNREAWIGSDGVTEQPKVPVSASSGIAPVSTFTPTAQSLQSDLLLLVYFSLFMVISQPIFLMEREFYEYVISYTTINHCSIYL